MDVTLVELTSIKPYERNPRLNDAAVDAVAKSIEEFGFRQPIVVDPEGVIVCGHTRWKAATKLGLARVPVHVARDLSPEQLRAYRIADNQTASIAEWDFEILPFELKDLQDDDFDLDLLGFDQDELAKMLAPVSGGGLIDPDDIPEPPDEAVTHPGDVWILGDHRLICGDSSSPADLDRLLTGAPIHLVNTDPPYNVHVEPRSNNAIAAGLSSFPVATPEPKAGGRPRRRAPVRKQLRPKDRPLANDSVSATEFCQLLDAWFGNMARVLLPGRGFYVWGGYANLACYPPCLERQGLYFSQAIVWDKQHPVLSRKDFMGAYELAFYGWRSGAAHVYLGPNNATDLWHVKKVSPQAMIHLTEKPVELAAQALQYSSRPGEHVLDLFGGSGSTLIAAQQTERKAFLMELDPLYCDVIVNRWEQFTGRVAVRTRESTARLQPCSHQALE